MFINEVCKECSLTKKAIEYYTEQGLIHPVVLENGYRDFSESDIMKLKKIAVLRRLGISVPDIQIVLASHGNEILLDVSYKKNLEIVDLQVKQKLIERFAQDNDWEYLHTQLDILEKKQSILQRMVVKFPGFYGKYLSLHFAPFLGDTIVSNVQQEAFETIIDFLDNVSITIPKELQEYLDEATQSFTSEMMVHTSESISVAISDMEKYMEDNKEILEQYMEIRKSDEYKQSPAYKLQELFSQFNSESGYNDTFLPAMERLSDSYKQYRNGLQKANKTFMQKYKNEYLSILEYDFNL